MDRSLPGAACISEDALAAFVEGLVEPPQFRAIEEHVADCAGCRADLARLARALQPALEGHATLGESDAAPMELLAGARVGRYVIETLIGAGAMGAVYAARDPDLDRTVAVKLLRADILSHDERPKMRARLLREAQAMARLSHPEVIAVYDVGALGDQLFVAMEYVEGETLRQWRVSRHREFGEILQAYERAGSGLAAAHESGLVHRDFKPDNVLVGRDGRVRVTDFGLARNLDQPEPNREPGRDDAGAPAAPTTLTRTGTLLGTPAYMAPEQLRGNVADARSDVFSFCVALYEALYGERPFAGSTVPVLKQAIEGGEIRRAPVMTRVPGWVRVVLLRGLRANPEERFASMRGLLDALRTAHAASRLRTRRRLTVGSAAVMAIGAFVVYASGATTVRQTGAPISRTTTATEEPRVLPGPRGTAANETVDSAPLPPPEPPPAFSLVAAKPPARRPSPVRAPTPALDKPTPPPGPPSSARRPPPVGNNGALILE
jgi:serine/threonine protein kinase